MGHGKLRIDPDRLFESFRRLEKGAITQRISAFVVHRLRARVGYIAAGRNQRLHQPTSRQSHGHDRQHEDAQIWARPAKCFESSSSTRWLNWCAAWARTRSIDRGDSRRRQGWEEPVAGPRSTHPLFGNGPPTFFSIAFIVMRSSSAGMRSLSFEGTAGVT